MKILVTGAAGFIASRIMATLSARGDEVLGLDIVPPKLNLDIFGKANKIVILPAKTSSGVRFPIAECNLSVALLNIPAKINRHSGMAETARPEYRKPL